MMDLDQYQTQLRSLNQSIQVEGDYFEFNCIGLAEEAGEVMGKLKRALRGEGFDRKGYILELGDVLGYLALAAGAKGIEMSELFQLLPSQRPIMKDHRLHIIANSKDLYHAANQLLQSLEQNDKTHLKWLLSKVFASVCCCANASESGLPELVNLNLQKLNDRLERNGNLLGTGDNR
jgi:NTP pyrophosphatase (non-canonical NTP hydrolase)